MANHVSALKRARQNEKRRLRNRAGRAANRTIVRKFEAALAEGKAADVLRVTRNAAVFPPAVVTGGSLSPYFSGILHGGRL